MRFLIVLLVGIAIAPMARARVGTVRTVSGERFVGHVRFVGGGIRIVNSAANLAVTVAATNVAVVQFADEALTTPNEEAIFGVLPDNWREIEVGAVAPAGSTRVERRSFTVRGSGMTMDGERDSFHYVYQPVEGDFEIIARVTAVQHTRPNAKAGLMMRETMGEYARYAMVAVTAQQGGAFQSRTVDGRAAEIIPHADVRPPYWLRLRRRGQEFSGFKSFNGRQWVPMEQAHVPMGDKYYVGLAVASAREASLNWSSFDHVRADTRLEGQEFDPRVELTSGSVVIGRPFHADAERIEFYGGSRVTPVPSAAVARIVYQPLTVEQAWKARASRAGVWMGNGDFVDGDFLGIDRTQLRINSVLYGPRVFDLYDDVLAVVLRSGRRARPAVEISAHDGSTLLGANVSFANDEIILREPALGTVRLGAFAIRELRINPN